MMQRITLLEYTVHYAVLFSLCALQADVGNKYEIILISFQFFCLVLYKLGYWYVMTFLWTVGIGVDPKSAESTHPFL